MVKTQLRPAIAFLLALFCLCGSGATPGLAQKRFGFLSTLPPGTADAGPRGSLAIGTDGSIYGTNLHGVRSDRRGSVFKVTPAGSSWTYQDIYVFSGPDGEFPNAGVTIGPDSAVYGTTSSGGPAGSAGLVFRLTPPASGSTAWTKQDLHYFTGGDVGTRPQAELTLDDQGRIYGTTTLGGAANGGLVFRLTPPASGEGLWQARTLASFSAAGAGPGADPRSGLVNGANGVFYGTAQVGGASGVGAVFALEPTVGDKYRLRRLYSFKSDRMRNPFGQIALGSDGAIFGTAQFGGPNNCGGAYRLSPPASGGAWTFTALRNFAGGASDGCYPQGAALSSLGDVYVATAAGGAGGRVVKLSPASDGSYKRALLKTFGSDWSYPAGAPLVGEDGRVYGTTSYWGSVWRLR